MGKSYGVKIHYTKVCLCKATAMVRTALSRLQTVRRQVCRLTVLAVTWKGRHTNMNLWCISSIVVQEVHADKSNANAWRMTAVTNQKALLLYRITPAN